MNLTDADTEALHVVNVEAKRQAQLARTTATTPDEYRTKRDALYTLKHRVLDQWSPVANTIERHHIDNRAYYCLYFDTWSFHAPIDELTIADDRITETVSLQDFSADFQPEENTMPTRKALIHLKQDWGFDVNDYLPTPTSPTPQSKITPHTEAGSNPLGWPFLHSVTSVTSHCD